ncbi:MAG: hypothetical protein ABJE66_36770 [Deltaproteobacteria bacterium]
MLRLPSLIAVTLVACGNQEARPTRCVYQNVEYSIGATRCAPGRMTPPGYQVYECNDTGQGARETGVDCGTYGCPACTH